MIPAVWGVVAVWPGRGGAGYTGNHWTAIVRNRLLLLLLLLLPPPPPPYKH